MVYGKIKMETETAQANSSDTNNIGSGKSEDGRGSPPPNCAICLGQCKNKSFTDSCLHQFCFSCLLTWSKVKAECPLCKQNFKSIIHNVQSNQQYEKYMVEQTQEETVERIDIDRISNATRRFRYRTTLTLPRRDSMAIQQLLMLAEMFPSTTPRPAAEQRRRRSPTAFRRMVYRHNLWARPLPDFTGRFRDCSPEFYRYNDAQMHRLVPWINRELHYLLNENVAHISYVLSRILELLPQYHINSAEFRDAIHRYFRERTEHFLHELFCFASTPFDMTGYDRNVQYSSDPRISTMVNEIISSSDTDSDIVEVSTNQNEPIGNRMAAGTSRTHEPIDLSANDSVIPIESISQSDSDDDDDVMVVGYIKPPQERTPEVVDLAESDSDVMEHDPSRAGPSNAATPLVKLSLKRHLPSTSDSDESCDKYTPTLTPRECTPPLAATFASQPHLPSIDNPSTSETTSGGTTKRRRFSSNSSNLTPPLRRRCSSSGSTTTQWYSSSSDSTSTSYFSSDSTIGTSSFIASDSDTSSSTSYTRRYKKKSKRDSHRKENYKYHKKGKGTKDKKSKAVSHKSNKKIKSKSNKTKKSRKKENKSKSNEESIEQTPPTSEQLSTSRMEPSTSRIEPSKGKRLKSVVKVMSQRRNSSSSQGTP